MDSSGAPAGRIGGGSVVRAQYGRDPARPNPVDQTMDGARLWAQIGDQGERLPLLTLGEARAVLPLLQHLVEQRGELADVAEELATRLARRIPAEE